MSEMIKLGISMGYPVNWGFERILRDLIQNFYDSIGSECFGKEFSYKYGRNDDGSYKLEMRTLGHPFAIRIKYNIRNIFMCEEDFGTDSFAETLVRFIDVMLHAFGSSRSNRLNVMFTEFGAYLIKNAGFISQCKNIWITLAESLPMEKGKT